jgi:hypothetical protein
MIQNIAFRMFLICLFTCATLVLILIWSPQEFPHEPFAKTAATFFVTGLASFLVWFSGTLIVIKKNSGR